MCPLARVDMGPRCGAEECPFHSTRNATGCWHGEAADAKTWAMHKQMDARKVSSEVAGRKSRVIRYGRIWAYADWCEDLRNPDDEARLEWERAKDEPPYDMEFLAWLTPERFARMLDPQTYDAWKSATGVAVKEKDVRTFLLL